MAHMSGASHDFSDIARENPQLILFVLPPKTQKLEKKIKSKLAKFHQMASPITV
jgi:hypothetical protein